MSIREFLVKSRKMKMTKLIMMIGAAAFALGAAAMTLEDGFKNPPSSAKPHTWYHVMNGNATKAGISCDFEAIAKAGLGGVQLFDVGCHMPVGELKFGSDEWFDFLRHAHFEAKRLGIELCLVNGAGWANSGGPWITPEYGMKQVVASEVKVVGPKAGWMTVLKRETNDNGFYGDIAVLAYPTPKPGPKISGFNIKCGSVRARYTRDTREFPPSTIVSKNSVIDLTDKMSADGTLVWNVPDGAWTVLRIGYICNGKTCLASSDSGKGLEVDKLSAKAMDFHFDSYVGRLCRMVGITAGADTTSGLSCVQVDSWEVGCQNWTQGLEKTFEARFGYSIRPYLPVFAGRTVESVNETERFLEDFRRLLADLIAENFSGRLVRRCHENGLKCTIEPYGIGNTDDLQYGQDVDIPMAEFWCKLGEDGLGFWNTGNSRLAASLAHVWGRRYVASESFTSMPGRGGRWQTMPFSIKNHADRAYCDGINRIVYHRFAHQPWPGDKYVPGMTMGRWGMHLDRTQTWWHLAPEWFRYQSRCQWMLQEGRFVADVLYWCGETAPNACYGNLGMPKGYDWDVCATKVVEQLKVRNGKVVAPGGVEYEMLVLPFAGTEDVRSEGAMDADASADSMSERMLHKIGELADAGARIVAPQRPVRAPGVEGLRLGKEKYASLVDSIWSKGVIECSPAEALERLGVKPDFETDAVGARWIHRRDDFADWYFVTRDNGDQASFEASFRMAGTVPELWDPETGRIRPAPVWREDGGRTFVSLDFPPSGSAFVVFRKGDAKRHVVKVAASTDLENPAERRHSLVIKKAEYGFFPDMLKPGKDKPSDSRVVDITKEVAARVSDGRIAVQIDTRYAHFTGMPKPIKERVSRISYSYDGQDFSVELKNGELFRIPAVTDTDPVAAPPTWEWRDGGLLAWTPLTAELTYSDGKKARVKANPPPIIAVNGEWRVEFPSGWGAPAVATFPRLESWTESNDDGIKYFSGTATYRKKVSGVRCQGAGVRVMLDLGEVKNFAEVTVNGKKYPPFWRPPFRVDVTDAIKPGSDTLDLEIKVTNLWPNRLIGDDRLFEDDCEWIGRTRKGAKEVKIKKIPQWVKEGKPSPTGRHTFTMFKHWSKEDELLESGLIGPVTIRFGALAED